MKKLNVAIIGYKFMGKAHSNAWLSAPRFFDVPFQPVLKVACGRDAEGVGALAERWGWEETAQDWREVVSRKDIDIVDISTPTALHAEIAIAAAGAGKHVFCEKPMATSAAEAWAMYEAAERAHIVHYLNHNYRRCPAVSFARRLIDDEKIGRIYHWRGAYLQDWIMDPNFPLVWHLQKEHAGAGPHFDLGSHSVDLARYLVGDIDAVCALSASFIPERPLPGSGAGTFTAGGAEARDATTKAGVPEKRVETGRVTVEDAAFMIAQFQNGALGSFDTTRFAGGRRNFNAFEIYGSKGSIVFDQERMNELQIFLQDDPKDEQGFRSLLVTNPTHPYLEGWWPPGHIVGYEHAFTHAVVDFLRAIDGDGRIEPSFLDGVRIMEVLEAGLESARTGQRVRVARRSASS